MDVKSNHKAGIRKVASGLYRRLPMELTASIDVLRSYRHRLYLDDTLFLHIPKNGGVTISKAVYGRDILHVKLSSILKLHPNPKRLRVVIIYRDPIERFISAANFVRTGGTSARQTDHKDIYDNVSWNDLNSIATILDLQLEEDLDPVFRPQSHYLDENIKNLSIYRLEEIGCLLKAEFSVDFSNIATHNVSTKYFTRSDLDPDLEKKLRHFYCSDYEILHRHLNTEN